MIDTYKYWSTKSLNTLLNELYVRKKYVNQGVSDITFIQHIENIIAEREDRL
jgi:hypothetical protein